MQDNITITGDGEETTFAGSAAADEENGDLNRGGQATLDQGRETSDPADDDPDNQEIRHPDETIAPVADVESEELDARAAAEERDEELAAQGGFPG